MAKKHQPKVQTRMIAWREYCPNKQLPVLLTVQDLIQYHVNKEAESYVSIPTPPLPPPEPAKKVKWSAAAAYAFGAGVIKSLLP